MYDDIDKCDQLKLFDEIHKPDIRFKNWGNYSDQRVLYNEIAKIELSPKAPKEIRIEFDLARNVFVYSHHSYRLTSVAAQIALGALEKALMIRFKDEYKKERGNKISFSSILNFCIETRRLTSEFFLHSSYADREMLYEKYKKSTYIKELNEYLDLRFFCNNQIRIKRNNLTHRTHKADIPWNNLDTLRFVQGIINYSYR